MSAVLNHPYLQMTHKVTLKLFSMVPSLVQKGGSDFTLSQIFYLRVSGEHLQLSLRELPEPQDIIFECGLLWSKAKR